MSIPRLLIVIGVLGAAGCYSARDWDDRPTPPPVRTDHGYVVVEVPAPDYYFQDGAFVATGGRRLVIREMNQQPVDTATRDAAPVATPAAAPSTSAIVAIPHASTAATSPSAKTVQDTTTRPATAAAMPSGPATGPASAATMARTTP